MSGSIGKGREGMALFAVCVLIGKTTKGDGRRIWIWIWMGESDGKARSG